MAKAAYWTVTDVEAQAAAAMHQLPNLKGCDVHSTVLLSGVATLTVWLPTTRLQSVKDMMMPIRQAVKTAGVPTEPSQFTAT